MIGKLHLITFPDVIFTARDAGAIDGITHNDISSTLPPPSCYPGMQSALHPLTVRFSKLPARQIESLWLLFLIYFWLIASCGELFFVLLS